VSSGQSLLALHLGLVMGLLLLALNLGLVTGLLLLELNLGRVLLSAVQLGLLLTRTLVLVLSVVQLGHVSSALQPEPTLRERCSELWLWEAYLELPLSVRDLERDLEPSLGL